MSPPHPLDKPELHARVRRIAEKMRDRLPAPQSDLDEVAQQLWLGVIRRWHRFDGSRGTAEAFVIVAARSEARTLIRDAGRAKRDPKRTCPMTDAVEATLEAAAGPPADRDDTAAWMARVLAALTPIEAEAALYIMRFGADHARNRLGLSRSQWVQIRQAIRLALETENHKNSSPKSAGRAGDGVSNS